MSGVNPPAAVIPLPHRMMWDIQNVLDEIANGDGDARAIQAEVIKYAGLLRGHPVDHATGRL